MKEKLAMIVRQICVLSLFLATSFVLYRKIIFSPGVIGMQTEWSIPPFSGQVKQLLGWGSYAWWPHWDFGSSASPGPGLVLKAFYYFLASAGMDGNSISKFISVFVVTLAGYSMFCLCRQMKIGHFSSIISGFFYMMTPRVFDQLVLGHPGPILDYALLPLVLVFFINSLDGKHGFKSLLLAAVLFSFATNHHRSVLLAAVTLILFYFVCGPNRRSRHGLLIGLRNITVMFLISFLLLGFWTIPFTGYYGHLGQKASAALGYVPVRFGFDPGCNLEDAWRLTGFHTPYMQQAAIQWNLWCSLSFLPAILAFFALLLKPKDRRAIFFGLLAILGIALASGSKGPLGSTWIWLVENTLMSVYRDPNVWIQLACMGYAVLLGLSSEAFLARARALAKPIKMRLRVRATSIIFSSKAHVTSFLIVLLLFNSIIFAYSWPFLTGNFAGNMQTYEFGRKYEELWQWLSGEPEDFRVLWLPAPYPTLYPGTNFKQGGYDLMAMYAGKPVLYQGHPTTSPPFVHFIIKTLYENRTEHLAELLGLANIKYIVFDTNKTCSPALTDNYWVKFFFPEMRFTNEKLITTLQQQKCIDLVAVKDSILIFENKKYLPHIFPVGQIGLFAGDLDALVSMSYIENLDLENLGLVFVSQLSSSELETLSKLPNVKIIIQDGHFLDLVLTAASREYVLRPIEYAVEESPDKGWTPLFWGWYGWYHQAQLDRALFTFVPSTLVVPYTVEQDGDYDVYLKLYFSNRASNITVYLEDSRIGETSTKTSAELGFKWVSFGSVHLNQGNYHLRVGSTEGGNALASIAIVPRSVMEEASQMVADLIRDKQTILISELKWQQLTDSWIRISGSEILRNATEYNRWPEGEPFILHNEGNTLIASVYFSNPRGVEEYLQAYQPIDPPIDLKTYPYFELNYELDDPLSQWFIVILYVDYDGDGEIDVWFRLSNQWEQKVTSTLRSDGIYDVCLGSPRYSIFRVNLLEVLEELFPNKETYNLMSIIYDFSKLPSFDASGAKAKNYTFHVKEILLGGGGSLSDIGVSASQGSALPVYPRVPIISQLPYVPKEGSYKIYLRASSNTRVSTLALRINTSEFEVSLSPLNSSFQWYEIGELHLPEGLSDISFHTDANDRVYLDQLLITESACTSVPATVNLTHQRINPTKYAISSQASEPFYMVFSEAYHDSWKVNLEDGKQVQSYPAYSVANVFFVNKTGNSKITLEFEEQRLYDIGNYTSLFSFIVVLSLILTPNRFLKFSHIKKKHTIVEAKDIARSIPANKREFTVKYH